MRVDWESLWAREARQKQLPSLHGIVSRYTKEPGVIGMHGGLPPAETFPFTSLAAGLLPLQDEGEAAAPAAGSVLSVQEPALVAAAQQYNMNAQGYTPLVAWARDLVVSMHQPATLKQQPQPQPPPQHLPCARGAAAAADDDACAAAPGAAPSAAPTSTSAAAAAAAADGPVGLDVVITPGASAALDALVRILVNPGDAVVCEEYTYAHMVEAHLLPLGCELVPAPLDAGGLIPAALDALLAARQAGGLPMPRVLYLIPTGQNPTGAVLSRQRMQEIYDVAQRWDLIIFEDDAYYFLQYSSSSSTPAAAAAAAADAGQQQQPVQGQPGDVPGLNLQAGFLSLDTDGRVVRVDTLSKLLGPGFRLGWLSGPPPLVSKVGLYMAGISIGANMVSQVLLHELLSKAWGPEGFRAFVARLQRRYARQAAVAAAAAEAQLSGLAEWQPARAGMFMWLRLTGDVDSQALIEAAAASKVMVVPGHLISVRHLQAAHRRKQQQLAALAATAAAAAAAGGSAPVEAVQQQQQQQQEDSAALLARLQQLTQDLNQELSSGGSSSSSTAAASLLAQQLAGVSQQLQHQLLQGGSAAAPGSSSSSSSSSSFDAGSGGAAAAPEPCAFFRVSFVSVPAEALQEGFARLRGAILACQGPKTPPGEETELASCSSSIGSAGGGCGGTPAGGALQLACGGGGGGGGGGGCRRSGGGGAGGTCAPTPSRASRGLAGVVALTGGGGVSEEAAAGAAAAAAAAVCCTPAAPDSALC